MTCPPSNMWSKRQFLKRGILGLITICGSFAILNHLLSKVRALPIVTYPDPILRRSSQPIDVFDDKLISLVDKMTTILRTRAPIDFFLRASLCKGLSAPQVGINTRLTLCGLYGEIKTLVNPELIEKNGFFENREHCLSLPQHETLGIQRSQFVRVRYQELNGSVNELTATKQSAGLIEHEIDHLNGILYIDHKKRP